MTFVMPARVATAGIESLHIDMTMRELRDLNRIVEAAASSSSSSSALLEGNARDQTPALIQALIRHLAKKLNMELSGACVTSIVTPVAELESDGRIRLVSRERLKAALIHVEQIVTGTKR